jgi:Flp pilus assembly protein TadG
MTRPRSRHDADGSVTVELVLLTPVFLALLMFVIGVGRLADANGQLAGAARDAARAASQSSSPAAAVTAAQQTAAADITGAGITCGHLDVRTDTSTFTPGGVVRVNVSCVTTLADVALAGFPGHKTLTAAAAAPLDRYASTR